MTTLQATVGARGAARIWEAPRFYAWLLFALSIGLLYGAVDGFTWSYPFESLWRNVTANLYYGIQTEYGVFPWYWYLSAVVEYWTGLAAAMSALCLIGAVRLPQPFVAAGLIALTYSLFGHKELRFIYPAVLLAVIVSGVGLAQLVSWIGEALREQAVNREVFAFFKHEDEPSGALNAVKVARMNGVDAKPFMLRG